MKKRDIILIGDDKLSRKAREKSRTGLYHVIFRGVSRQNIFEESNDFEKLIEILKAVKANLGLQIYAYCLMSNHVHLFVKEKDIGDISKIMHKILTKYAGWFNFKYLRTGILFENRYKSEPVEDERYFLSLIRYIHQNPQKAGMVKKLEEYPWSSYREYVNITKAGITDIDFALDILSDNIKIAIEKFIEFNNVVEYEQYEISKAYKKTEDYIKRQIISVLNGQEPHTLKAMPKDERNRIIITLIKEKGISKSALERATGISRGTIIRICNFQI